MSKTGNFDTIRDQVREISRIAAAVPEEFRLKCFELLMTHLLKANAVPPAGAAAIARAAGLSADAMSAAAPAVAAAPVPMVTPSYTSAPPMSPLITAFLRKIGVTYEQFAQVVGCVHGNVVFLREPHGDGGARTQVEWTLLVALKNALVKGSFVVDPEEVRIVCQERGVFDRRNFYTVFRRHAELFRSAPEPGGKPQPLSSRGIAALGALVKELSGQT